MKPVGKDVSSEQNWLITGGCGFIGTALIRRILQEDPRARIRVLDNLSVGRREDLQNAILPGRSENEEGKFEIRSPKFETNSKFEYQNTKTTARASDGLGHFEFEVLDLFRVSDFDIRALTSPIQLIIGDITDPNACMACAKDTDIIVHLAANTGVGPSVEDPLGDMENNVRGILNMLEAARHNGVKRFIFASSGAPVGEVEPPIHEELAAHPVSPYGASKLAGEGYCSAYFRTFGVGTVALRFGNVYGPGSGHKNSVVAKFIRQAMDGIPCEIYGDGTQTRDFIYIGDLVRAILSASDSGRADCRGEVFQIASSREHTINEVAELLKLECGRHGIDMEIRHGDVRLGDVKRNYSDTSKAARVLGWQPEVGMREGVRETVLWFLGKAKARNSKLEIRNPGETENKRFHWAGKFE